MTTNIRHQHSANGHNKKKNNWQASKAVVHMFV